MPPSTAPAPATPPPTTPDRPPPATSEGATDAPPTASFRLGYQPALDGLRGVAVIMVVLYHVGSYLWLGSPAWTLHAGFLGVDLFFVLSGFLITVLLLGEADRRGGVALGGFATRRLRRLAPVLVAVMAALLALALSGKMYATDSVLETTVPVLTFTHNWAVAAGDPVLVGHLWSIGVEAQFYLLWAVAVVLALRTPRPHVVLAVVALVGIVAVVAWRAYLLDDGAELFALYVRTSTRLDAPLIGALAGVVASAGWLPWFRGRVAAVSGATGLVLVVSAAVVLDFGDPTLYRGLFAAIALCAALGVLAAVRSAPGPFVRVLSVRPLIAAGIISYSMYVWHLPVFQIVLKNTRGWEVLPRAAIALGISLALAVLSYRFIERPFLRRRRPTRA
ncbi:MAG TPA: acyltransferase [Acidimicrobiales bacterium]|nr:acyltransferase [Acidimicrobiales bacterium]